MIVVWVLGSGARAGRFAPIMWEQSNTRVVCACDMEQRAVLNCRVCGWMVWAVWSVRHGCLFFGEGVLVIGFVCSFFFCWLFFSLRLLKSS